MSGDFKIFIFSVALPTALLIFGLFSGQYSIALNSVLTVICILALMTIYKKYSFLSSGTYYSLIVFILLSVFAGRTLNIYAVIPSWDKILHFLSGFVLVSAGKDICVRLDDNTDNLRLIKLFSLIFAVALAGVWEIYEFTIDNILGTVSQNGSLDDTMWDMIAGSASAVIAVLFVQNKTS